MRNHRRVWSFGVLALLCFLAVGSVDSGDSGDSSSGSSTSSTGASVSSPTADELPKIGEVGKLSEGGTGSIVARSKDDFDEMLTLLSAKDNDGLTKLVAEGRVFITKDGTKAKVLEYGGWGGGLRVRIMSGNFKGDDGWIVEQEFHGGK